MEPEAGTEATGVTAVTAASGAIVGRYLTNSYL
jgi:hypothetical protein